MTKCITIYKKYRNKWPTIWPNSCVHASRFCAIDSLYPYHSGSFLWHGCNPTIVAMTVHEPSCIWVICHQCTHLHSDWSPTPYLNLLLPTPPNVENRPMMSPWHLKTRCMLTESGFHLQRVDDTVITFRYFVSVNNIFMLYITCFMTTETLSLSEEWEYLWESRCRVDFIVLVRYEMKISSVHNLKFALHKIWSCKLDTYYELSKSSIKNNNCDIGYQI